MDQAGWVPVAVDPLVPAARLGALMVERRTAQGLDLVSMARRSHGMFTPSYLENVERGRVELDDELIGHLVGLYEVEAGPVVPQRSELILDLDSQRIGVGDQSVPFDSLHADDVLNRYLSLIYLLRGAEPGTDLVLRDADIDILAKSLGYSQDDVHTELRTMIAAPQSVQQAKNVRTRTIVLAAGVFVAMTALGALVLVRSNDPSPTEVLGATQTLVTTGLPAELGAAAEASIDYDFRAVLPGWQIGYAQDHPDFLGVTLSAGKTITVHVEPNATSESVAAVLMHEAGHAIDLEYLDDTTRAEWIALRSMPPTWWPGDGLSDFAVGAGDFAEAVAAVTTGAPSNSLYGEFTQEQLNFVEAILADIENS